MVKSKRIQNLIAMLTFAVLVLSSSLEIFAERKVESDDARLSSMASSSPIEPMRAGNDSTLGDNEIFFTIKPDLRRCASPMCGGFFVRRVNLAKTRCADGRSATECYVSDIDWNGQAQVEPKKALLRGTIIVRNDKRFGKLGTLKVSESWRAASENMPVGEYFRVNDRGLRCITFPCPTHSEARLNSSANREIAGVDLSGAHAPDNATSEAFTAMTGPQGVLVAGRHERVTGSGGRSETLKASQFYLRNQTGQATGPKDSKPCIKTGCSKQVCADHTVITTCIYREEYACYQKAKCERQADGNCGFTKTPGLAACLAGKK